MPEPIINFTSNWNGKLFCKFFTTIRLKNDYKYAIGRTYHIQQNAKDIGPGIIRSIMHFQLHQLKPFMSYLDMGYGPDQSKEIILTMYKNKIINGQPINWHNQQLSLILIEMPDRKVPHLPDHYFGTYQDAPGA